MRKRLVCLVLLSVTIAATALYDSGKASATERDMVKTKRLGPPTEALGYPRQPARISKGNIVARIIQSVIELRTMEPQPDRIRTTIKAPTPAEAGVGNHHCYRH